MTKGFLAIILHAHLPFVRHPEHAHSLEEHWFYEALTESYLPLLLVFEDLLRDGVDFRLSLSITPTLLSMLMDPFLKTRYLKRLDLLNELAGKECRRTERHPPFHNLALRYDRQLRRIRRTFVDDYKGNLIEPFRRLQELGKIELLASAATHGYLPHLMINPSAVRAQVAVGVEHHRQVFDRDPRGFWLPECGYARGIDEELSQQGIDYTILETHGLTRAQSRPKYGVYAPLYCPSGLAVFGRDPESSRQVWSATEGYPGDYDYREFYRDIAYDLDLDYIKPYIHPDGIRLDTGFKYYRITGRGNQKEVYCPERADKKAEIQAENFIFNRGKQAEYLCSVMDRPPVIVAPYDAELYGHWWFEGPKWLDTVFRKLNSEPTPLRPVTLSEYLTEYPSNQVSIPCSSSWGNNGYHEPWLNEKNHWIYPHLHQGARSMEGLARKVLPAGTLSRRALCQAARELLLAQSSDWAFMMDTGAMKDYATARTKTHLFRFNKLKQDIESGSIDENWLSAVEIIDNIFPHIDPAYFIGGEEP
jgi:1,4-alpha-glucan branching enzyme